jgi:hypothetical protein
LKNETKRKKMEEKISIYLVDASKQARGHTLKQPHLRGDRRHVGSDFLVACFWGSHSPCHWVVCRIISSAAAGRATGACALRPRAS